MSGEIVWKLYCFSVVHGLWREKSKSPVVKAPEKELFSGDTQVSVRPGAKGLSLKILRIFSDEICEFQRGWGELRETVLV